MLYTINEIMSAVRQELAEANKELGIAEGFTDDDYKYLGVIAAAAKRLPERVIYKEKTYKLLKDFPNISTGMTLMWVKKFNGYTPSCTKNGKQIIIPAEIVENNSDWFLENE